MKTAAAFTILAGLAAAAPAPAIEARSLQLGRRFDGPVTVPLKHTEPVRGPGFNAFEASKIHLATKYPQFFDEDQLRALHKRGGDLQVSVFGHDRLYTAPTSFGTPAQDLHLLVDTGSAALWAFSEKCAGCGTGVFDHTKSSSFQNTSNPAQYAYGSGNTGVKGWNVKDTIGLAGVQTEGVEFALIDEEKNAHLNQTSAGLSGWSWPIIVSANGTKALPVPYVQATNGQWAEPTFGLYLPRHNPRAEAHGTQSKGDGALTVSGTDPKYYDGELAWTERKLLSPEKHRFDFAWAVDFPHITVNGAQVALTEGGGVGAVLDSGTTLIFGTPQEVKKFYENVPGAKDEGDGTWTVACDAFNNTVSFNLAGKDWPIDPSDLIFERDEGGCMGAIAVNPGLQMRQHWLVGAAFLKNVYTAHSYNPPRVGFAKLKDGL